MEEFKINDCVESLVTGRKGVIQATYPDDQYLMYHGKGYEHLYSDQMRHIEEKDVPFAVHYRADIKPRDN
jgi:hypothetical protein